MEQLIGKFEGFVEVKQEDRVENGVMSGFGFVAVESRKGPRKFAGTCTARQIARVTRRARNLEPKEIMGRLKLELERRINSGKVEEDRQERAVVAKFLLRELSTEVILELLYELK